LWFCFQEEINEASKQEVKFSDLFTIKANFKALLFTCILVTFQQFTGINVVLFYMQNIFIAANSSVPIDQAPIIIGAVQLLASCATPVVVDWLGRRVLLVFSGIGTTLSLVSSLFCFRKIFRNIIFLSSQIPRCIFQAVEINFKTRKNLITF